MLSAALTEEQKVLDFAFTAKLFFFFLVLFDSVPLLQYLLTI